MAATAAALAGLLTTNADINYYTQQSIFWNAKYEANLAQLQIQQKEEDAWEKAYDDAFYAEEGHEKKFRNGKIVIRENDYAARQYAKEKARKYNEETLMELADKDIEYDTMKCMYDTMLETLRAKQESQKTLTSSSAQDTGLLQS